MTGTQPQEAADAAQDAGGDPADEAAQPGRPLPSGDVGGQPPAAMENPAEDESAQEWWDDPSLPWKHKPTKADIACMGWLSVVAIYGLVMLPLRPGLLASAPHVLASLGSWSGSVTVGSRAAVGDPWWPLVWFFGTIGLVKFDWVYWWAGRLWGRNLIEVWSGRSERARRMNAWTERLARRYETVAIALTYLPLPIPSGVVYLVLGEAGTSLKKFITVTLVSSLIAGGVYLGIGYWIGEPAVVAMDTYGRYLWYVSLALLVFVIWNAWRQARQGTEPAGRA
ncbi:MAG: VTT domain-containing protein [Propionicimonas sp.]|uniref:DedA family protein n=1 Tax=Propionicimonas sp. TaxID=1955623 RepID=UPI002B21D9A9|nr:VTT domain-containing protein [Propionicimonas sp.]MEA4944182.1 VTT domain-containing protein [Propionicimonas sp.]MEA5052377.1 VTT domain-containing protein [Propionicimonas sp.]MEA5118296.1 VTT domain-containing protein [Propionicimonas sp.]